MGKIYYRSNKTFEIVPVKPMYYVLLVLISLMFGLGITLWSFHTTKENEYRSISPEEKLIIIQEHNRFSEQKLIEKLRELKVKFPHIVLAQAKLETGNFKSKVFRENNNLFGMRESGMRITTSKGTENNHAYYNDWYESLLDYCFYQSRYLSGIQTEGQYLQYLSQSYAESPKYVNILVGIIRKENLKKHFVN
jgi:hypothetical protein